MTVRPSFLGDELEIHGALPAGFEYPLRCFYCVLTRLLTFLKGATMRRDVCTIVFHCCTGGSQCEHTCASAWNKPRLTSCHIDRTESAYSYASRLMSLSSPPVAVYLDLGG